MAESSVRTPDLCIIGGGVAGYSLALAGVALGLTCILVDKRQLGRSQAADLALDMLIEGGRRALPQGADAQAAFERLRLRIGSAINSGASSFTATRLRAAGVTVLEGAARFTSPTLLSVGNEAIRAHRFVIATGARPRLPRIEGLDLIRPLTADSVAGLATLPPSLVVFGGTQAAFELAQTFQRLGSQVTLVRPAGSEWLDPEFDAVIVQALRRDGVDVRDATGALTLQPRGAGFDLALEGHHEAPINATRLLIAIGASPYFEGLGLSRAGVGKHDGGLKVGHNLRTSNGKVFAIGDVLGDGASGPAAIAAQVSILLRAAFFRQQVRFDSAHVPRIIRTSPPFAHVGASEIEAQGRGGTLEVFRSTFAENDRAIAAGTANGHVKLVAGPRGRILGATIFGPQAPELIAPWSLALAQGIPLGAMVAAPLALPSLGDAPRRAALSYVTTQLKKPLLRRVRNLVRWLG